MRPHHKPLAKIPGPRLPPRLIAGLTWDALRGRSRSIAHDAALAAAVLGGALEVVGAEHVPRQGPCLVICNHYSRPGFGAWWTVLALTAAIAAQRAPDAAVEIGWVMTARWTFPGHPWRRRLCGPVTRWAFARAAAMHGFVTMPPMPPDPRESHARAAAVLRAVRLARKAAVEGGMIGLAPEGRDVDPALDADAPFLPGRLATPPAGVGEFIALLAGAGLPLLPAGVSEIDGRLHVAFGPLFRPAIPADRAARDTAVAGQVMTAIARLVA